ncbi:LysR family transcriptional regulator [Salinibacterium sp. NG253]|uniref:LysR family transcriptional regulator n=1 Tax=Salinibacterium sp. NG253 TaxID=2792039 RepID=UPI0018CD6306|nr:LysR family transcriptional regulator [Salinibacterium sp. NG253]MBH0116776.1 LysR family transcriptional regulator [Salinibacterium sp. NG253]
MNFWRLQCFVALVEERHFGRAAKRLFVSQPALSQQIKQLEDALNAELIVRTPTVEPTASGLRLYEGALNILELVDETVQKVSPEGTHASGTLRLRYSRSIAAERTFPLVARFRDLFPHVEVTAQTTWTAGAIEDVRAGDADVVFVRLPLADSDGLETYELGADEQRAVVGANHPLAGRHSVSRVELAHENLIHWSRGDAAGNFDSVVGDVRQGGTLNLGASQPDFGHRMESVMHGDGFALAHAELEHSLPGGVVMIPIAPQPPMSVWGVAWSANGKGRAGALAANLVASIQQQNAVGAAGPPGH